MNHLKIVVAWRHRLRVAWVILVRGELNLFGPEMPNADVGIGDQATYGAP